MNASRAKPQLPPKPQRLKEALASFLSEKERAGMVSSYDLIGQVAVLEIPRALGRKATRIARTLLSLQPAVKTVAKIMAEHKGAFRVRRVKILAGKRKLLTLHTEWGCKMKVHVGKVFFSPRLSFERQRICGLIKPGERVAVFFAGVGPYALIFGKHSPAEKIVAIELNPLAAKLMKENVLLNRLEGKVEALQGDVRKVVPKRLAGQFDRVVMPLPKGGEDFLEEAFLALKPRGGKIHFYAFVSRFDPFTPPKEAIQRVAERLGRNAEFTGERVARSFSASQVQAVIDFEVS